MNTRFFIKKGRWGCFLLAVSLILVGCASQNSSPTISVVSPTDAPAVQATTETTEVITTPASTPSFSATLAPLDSNPQQAALLEFILNELAGVDKQHLLIAWVKPNLNDPRSTLDLSKENILRAWIYLDGKLSDSTADYYFQSYTQETTGPWKFAYMAFSINTISPGYTAATVRIDRIPGLAGGKGELVELAQDNQQWSVKSQRTTWTR